MNADDLTILLAQVRMLCGDRLNDLLVPSEIAALAEAVVAAWPQTPVAAPFPTLDFLVPDASFPVVRHYR